MEETCLLGQSWGGSTVAAPAMSLPCFPINIGETKKKRGRKKKDRKRREGQSREERKDEEKRKEKEKKDKREKKRGGR
jgi:hypothetical protein